jgi:hypothetical protein
MSTSINELPTDPTGGGTIGGNVSISVSEQNSTSQGQSQGMNNNMSLDQTTINQIVNGLQQASSTGATQLASRDIPRNVDGMVSDPQIQPTYVPHTNNQDYIKDYDENDDIIRNYEKKEQYNSNLDQLYDEIQIPLLLSVLYFLFQLPIVKKTVYNHFPILCLNDGNYNINGYLFTSILFGLLYYLLYKIVTHFNTF